MYKVFYIIVLLIEYYKMWCFFFFYGCLVYKQFGIRCELFKYLYFFDGLRILLILNLLYEGYRVCFQIYDRVI